MRQEFFYFLENEHTQELQELITFLKISQKGALKESEVIYMLLKLYPRFMASNNYQEWIGKQIGVPYMSEGCTERLEAVFGKSEKANIDAIKRLMVASVYHLPGCNNLLRKDSWFRSVVEIVENLPLCVYLTLPEETKEFPVVYINIHAEALTGYTRYELLGLRCMFYHGDESSEHSELKSAIVSSKPIRAGINIYRKDGTVLPTIVMCKPIYDMYGKYRFALTVQSEDFSSESLRTMADFLSLIPNSFVGS